MTLQEPMEEPGGLVPPHLQSGVGGTVPTQEHWICKNPDCKNFQQPIYLNTKE